MAVKKVDGVYDAGFSYETGSGWVSYDSSRTTPEEFQEKLRDLTGFIARPASAGELSAPANDLPVDSLSGEHHHGDGHKH